MASAYKLSAPLNKCSAVPDVPCCHPCLLKNLLISIQPITSSCLLFWITATVTWHHHREGQQFTPSHCALESGKRESISPQHALSTTTISHDHAVSIEHIPSVIGVPCCYYGSISLVKLCQSQANKSYCLLISANPPVLWYQFLIAQMWQSTATQ